MATAKKQAPLKQAPPLQQKARPVGARKDGGRRVYWKPHEKALLAAEAAKVIHTGQATSAVQALNVAQRILPEERRRPSLHQVGDQPWYRPLLAAEIAKLQDADEDAKDAAAKAEAEAQETVHEAPAPAVATTPASDLSGRAVATMDAPEAVAAGLGHAMLNLRAMLVDELAGIFVEAALKAMGSALLGGAQPAIELAPAHTGNGAQRVVFHREPSAPRKPSVLVVGLKGAQKTEIERDFATRFDLRFVGADESKDHLRAMTEKAATTVVMTDFISHSHQDIVKARSPHWVRQSGGLTQLRTTLAGLTN